MKNLDLNSILLHQVELYLDSLLSFLYGLLDQSSSSHHLSDKNLKLSK